MRLDDQGDVLVGGVVAAFFDRLVIAASYCLALVVPPISSVPTPAAFALSTNFRKAVIPAAGPFCTGNPPPQAASTLSPRFLASSPALAAGLRCSCDR